MHPFSENKSENVKQSFKHIALAVSFLMLFVGYQICITSFTHVHYVNGVMVSHSHPFSDDEHSHQKTEFSLIAHLSHFSSLVAVVSATIDIPWTLLATMNICPMVDELPVVSLSYISLRAPPCCSAI